MRREPGQTGWVRAPWQTWRVDRPPSRLSRLSLVLGAVSLLAACTGAAAGCGATPVSPSDCKATAPTKLGSLLAVQADPPDSTIRGVVPSAAPPAAGKPYEVRWLVDSRKASGQIRIQAAREGTGEVYRGAFSSSSTAGLVAVFPASLVFPAPGCWDADVFTGTAQGSLTFKVV